MKKDKGYVDSEYLRFVAKIVAKYKQRTYTLMHIELGHKVLDVGCGPGTDTIPIAQLTGATGQVVGVDYDEKMIAEADEQAEKADISQWVRHVHADASLLPFEPGYFDSVRSERLFQHLKDQDKAMTEMVRVTKSGGWVVALDTDWSTMSLDTTEINIEQRLKRFHTEHRFHNGFAGRQLYRLFKKRNLADISVEMAPILITNYAIAWQIAALHETEQAAITAGVITSDELDRLHKSLEQADADGVYFHCANQVIVAGRKN
ncbi:MAG: methyltransferase domain-containing protein [Desulfobacterales bacterium]|nr:MAG: methyltransferase domain-containing protein [Desulfobacterales bacterium]